MLFIAVIIVIPVVSILINGFFVTVAQRRVWNGLGNYLTIMTDDLFWISLVNNMRLFLSVPVMTFISLVIAAVLFDRIAGWKLYQSIIFTPYILAIPVVGIVFSYILQYRGILNAALSLLGMQWAVTDWLGTARTAIWSMIAVIVWKQFGFGVVLFLARLELCFPVPLRGGTHRRANWWQRMVNVTLPQLGHDHRVLHHGQPHQHAELGLRLRLRDDGRRAGHQHLRPGVLHLSEDLHQLPGFPGSSRGRCDPDHGDGPDRAGQLASQETGADGVKTARNRKQGIAVRILVQAFMVLIAVVVVFPLYFMLSNSLKTSTEFLHNPVGPPQSPTFQTFRDAIIGKGFPQWGGNSIVLSVFSIGITTIVSGLAALRLRQDAVQGQGVPLQLHDPPHGDPAHRHDHSPVPDDLRLPPPEHAAVGYRDLYRASWCPSLPTCSETSSSLSRAR